MLFGIEIEFSFLQHRSAVDVVWGVLGVGLKFHTELLTLGLTKKKKNIYIYIKKKKHFTFLFFGIEIEFCLLQHRSAVDVVGGVLGVGFEVGVVAHFGRGDAHDVATGLRLINSLNVVANISLTLELIW